MAAEPGPLVQGLWQRHAKAWGKLKFSSTWYKATCWRNLSHPGTAHHAPPNGRYVLAHGEGEAFHKRCIDCHPWWALAAAPQRGTKDAAMPHVNQGHVRDACKKSHKP
jgi:hypothetical protein